MTIKSSTSTRIFSGVRKFLHIHQFGDGPPQPVSVPTSSTAAQPTQVYHFESEAGHSPCLTSPPTTANSGLSPASTSDTSPTTLGSITEGVKADLTPKVSPEVEYNIAVEGLRDAEKILEQRHAAIKTKAKPRPAPKKSKSPKAAIKKEIPTTTGSPRIAALPSRLRTPSDRQHQYKGTAQEACDVLQRRQLIRELAYRAAFGCADAMGAFEELNAHYALKARHQHDTDIPDLILNFDGIHVSASQLRSVERNWISRYNATRKLNSLVERKQLGAEDCELIVEQLFPTKSREILNPEHFDIFMTGLGLEGIVTASEAKSITRLAVSVEEFEARARWTTTSQHRHAAQHTHNLSTLAIFEIPNDGYRSGVSFSTYPPAPRADLAHYLRILVEAAVYDQAFWKGYFFSNARSKLQSFYEAHRIQRQGLLTPPALTSYKRSWNYRETRLLQRGHLLCTLLSSFEYNTLTDFGLIRAIRGTFIPLPGQGYWDPDDLSTFLYHRVVSSGLAISSIPDIVALHPEHDSAFDNASAAARIKEELGEQAEAFRQEEEVRTREMEKSASTFEEMKMREMSRWGRMKVRWRKRFGKSVVVRPFDPFAEV
jgi:hypothetical protein